MSKYDRITSEELAQESLLAERNRIEQAVYLSAGALTDAMEALDTDSIYQCEKLGEQIAEHIGQLQKLQAHINKHGVQIFEDAYLDRRLCEAREKVSA